MLNKYREPSLNDQKLILINFTDDIILSIS